MDETRLKEIVATVLSVSPDVLDDDASTDTIPGWDSLRHLNLILALEEAFDIVIPDDDVGNLTSYPLIRLTVSDLTSGNN